MTDAILSNAEYGDAFRWDAFDEAATDTAGFLAEVDRDPSTIAVQPGNQA